MFQKSLILYFVLLSYLNLTFGFNNITTCVIDHDCTELLGVPNTVCLNKICVCHSDFYLWKGRCHLYHHRIHGVCHEDSHCTKNIQNSFCNSGSCECNYGYESNEDERSCDQIIGNRCSSLADCKSKAEGVLCHQETKTCACPDGQFYSINKVNKEPKCIDLPQGLNDTCQFESQCSSKINHSICDYNYHLYSAGLICKCQEGSIFVMINGKEECVKIEETDCLEDKTCENIDPLSQCIFGKCSCGPHAYLNPKMNECREYPKTLQNFCFQNSDCLKNIEGSECKENWPFSSYCTCQSNHVFNKTANKCVLAIGANCENDADCNMTDSLICGSNNKCNCDENFYFSKGHQCVAKPNGTVHKNCEIDSHCSLMKNTFCNKENSICTCIEGFTQFYNSTSELYTCKENFGNCERSRDCQNPHTVCIADEEQTRKFCSCESKYGIMFNQENAQHFCSTRMYNFCKTPKSGWGGGFCEDLIKNSYCKIIEEGPQGQEIKGVCTCDDFNGYAYNPKTMSCDLIK